MRTHVLRLLATCLAIVVLPTTVLAQVVTLYSTSFEAAQGFVLGDVNAQQGWQTDPVGGFASVVADAPAGFSGLRALRVASDAINDEGVFAFPSGFSEGWTAAESAGDVNLGVIVDMYLPSGQTSDAFLGFQVYDTTFERILAGLFVQADTGDVLLQAYSTDQNGTSNYVYPTGTTLSFDRWVQVSAIWDSSSGDVAWFWDDEEFQVAGAAAGSIPEEFDLITFPGAAGTPAGVAFFDDVFVAAVPVPEPAALATAAVGMGLVAWLAGSRRRCTRTQAALT